MTHVTQDTDHGFPSSQRRVTAPDIGTQHAYGANSEAEDSSSSTSVLGPYRFNVSDLTTQQLVRWVYKWIDHEFYHMLYDEWRGTSHWTNQSWQEYKAGLLRAQGIMLMSTEEYYAMQLQ